MRRNAFPSVVRTVCVAAAAAVSATCFAETACSVRSAATVLPVVELYTSEGCNSCPPADRWSSSLKQRSDVIALAFHVDYWDRLGWKDRFASAAYTQRQAQQVAAGAARFAYTPQVLLNGADWHGWVDAPITSSSTAAALADIALERHGNAVEAHVSARAASAPPQFSAYWAVTEDGFESAVKSGENAGVTLHHDNVVREYVPVPAWPAATPRTLRFESAPLGENGRPRKVVLVVQDARSQRPLQALALSSSGCGS